MNFKVCITILTCSLLAFSCKTKKIVSTPKRPSTAVKKTPKIATTPKKETTKDTPKSAPPVGSYKNKVSNYIDLYSAVAMEQMRLYKIPASITLAQGILESGAGSGDLTVRANNHFGIKCHGWKGATVYHDDDTKQECFRKYSNANFSFQDHSLFLTERKRYLDLFKLPNDDYKGWAKGLRKAGYATDPKYPAKLIGLIERYKLYNYDAEVLGKSKKDAKKITGKSDQYVVQKGDTLYSIARRHKISVDELKKYNGIEENTIHEGQTLYVKPLPKEF